MKKLYIKQKVFSIGEKFTVIDEHERPHYFVEGSFFQIPKRFSIQDAQGGEIGNITKKVFSLLPKFFLEVDGQEIILEKEFTFFKAKYSISAQGVRVEGNWWDMDFEVYAYGEQVATISKHWFTWGDSYEVTILDEDLERLIISLVIAIDCVKADESASSSASS
ncbi:LURP-one-related/scramblase family protein [Enterococcus olivae]